MRCRPSGGLQYPLGVGVGDLSDEEDGAGFIVSDDVEERFVGGDGEFGYAAAASARITNNVQIFLMCVLRPSARLVLAIGK